MERIQCLTCGSSFENAAQLMEHYFDEHYAKYMCHFCTAQFSDRATLDEHVRIDHIGKSYFACRSCPRYVTKKKDLKMHYEDRHRKLKDVLYCRLCDLWFADEDQMVMHTRYVHRHSPALLPTVATNRPPLIVTFKCQFCPQTFGSRYDHCSHTILSHGAYLFCSYCEKQFLSPTQQSNHFLRYHKETNSFTCVYCWVEFNSVRLLKIHQRLAHRQMVCCPKCNHLAPSADCLAIHREYEENTKATGATELQTRRESGPKLSAPRNADMLLCLICFIRVPAESFNEHAEDHLLERQPLSCNEHFEFLFDSDSIKRHVTCFRKEASRGLTMKQDPDGPSNASFTCEQCGFKAEDDNQLSRHRAWCHSIKFCRQCSQETVGRLGMKFHEVEHGAPFWPDEMRSDRFISTPRSNAPASSIIPLSKGDAEPSGQFPLQGTKRKFPPDINSSSNNNDIKNTSPIAKKSEKSPKSNNSNHKNIDLTMNGDQSKTTAVEKASFLEAVSELKKEIASDDSVSVGEEDVRPVREEFSANPSTTPKPRKIKSVSTSFSGTRSSYATNIAAAASVTPAIKMTNRNNEQLGSIPSNADSDSSDDEPTFTYSRSAKIIPIGPSLNSAKKTDTSFPIVPLAEENVQQPPSTSAAMKQPKYTCKLCYKCSMYKQSIQRHVENIHRIPLTTVGDHIEIREVEASPKKTKKQHGKTNHSGYCLECAKKDQEIKHLKKLLRKITNAANKIEKSSLV